MEGYKLIGRAEYFTTGKWVKYVKDISENKDMPVKGALVINVSKIIRFA